MKLRNKETGSIFKIEDLDLGNDKDGIWIGMTQYKSLAELNEVWEDYEEPKGFYYIRCNGDVELDQADMSSEHGASHKEIGNCFETEEEAQKAVEKLKAWRRLRDKGFRFKEWEYDDRYAMEMPCILIRVKKIRDCEEDLDICFGGEE